MSKHTRGPWTVDENEMMGRDIVSAGSRALICTQVYSPDDARLISAAPELLAALERVARLNHDSGEIGDGMLITIVSEARAAIAKATGSET